MSLGTTLNTIAHQLAKPHQQVIDDMMKEARQRPLSLAEVGVLEGEVATVRAWLPYDRPELRYEVASIRAETEEKLKAAEFESEALGPEQGGERYLLSVQVADLTGGEVGDQLRQQADQELERLYQQGVSAVQNKKLSKARGSLNQVALAEPQYKELVYYQEMVATGLFEQHFWQALGDGRPDDAFTLFYEFAETPAFATHRDKVAKDAAELADYFDALGDKRRRERKWLESYEAFRKAVDVRDKLELTTTLSTGIRRFVLEMENRFKHAEKAGQATTALAYLSIIESLHPEHPLLDREQRTSFEAVFDQAVVKVSLEPFAGTYGRQMASGISRYLLDTVPNEVRMVSKEQFQVVGDSQNQSAAYFMVEGEILRTDVEKREQPRREKRRVVTGTRRGPNPLVYKEVLVNHRDISNKAVISVSYRVVDPATAKVLFVETVSDRITAEATATQGMVQGDFVLEAIPARLPAEAEMFEDLIKSVSKQIGSELVSRLLALESRYEAAAADESEQNNYGAAAKQWAYAYAVSDPDSEARALYRLEMERAVLKN